MRPLDKKKQNAEYQPPENVEWRKASSKKGEVAPAWTALSALTGKTDEPLKLTTDEALNLLLKLKTKQKIYKLTNPLEEVTEPVIKEQGPKAADAIKVRTNAIYKEAAGPLCKTLGTFCAYCETSITGLVEVDHVANQSQYPTYTTKWENFLPACGACNSKKSDNPTREDEAKSPPFPKIEGDDLNKDAPFYDKIRGTNWVLNPDYYRWPDTNSDTFQFFKVRFEVQLRGDYFIPINPFDAANPANQVTEENINERRVRADGVYDGNKKYTNKVVQVVVEPEGKNLTIMCGLNENTVKEGTNVTYDRRVYNRTLAWFEVLNTVEPLRTARTTKDVDAQWPAILRTSKHVGFWSVWVTLLNQIQDPETHESLAKRFCSDKNISYPGTNRTDLKF